MSNTDVVLPAALDLTDLVMAGDNLSHHAEALKTLKAAKTDEDFKAGFAVAVRVLHADTDGLRKTVEQAEAIVKAGRKAVDAHTSFRIALVGQWLDHFPKASNADIARALYSDDSNARRKMVSRDRLALDTVKAARDAKAKAPEGAAIRIPSVTEAVKAIGAKTATEAKAIVQRAAKGEPLVADSTEPVKVKMATILSRAEGVLDGIRNVDADTVTPETLATLKAHVEKMAALVKAAEDAAKAKA